MVCRFNNFEYPPYKRKIYPTIGNLKRQKKETTSKRTCPGHPHLAEYPAHTRWNITIIIFKWLWIIVVSIFEIFVAIYWSILAEMGYGSTVERFMCIILATVCLLINLCWVSLTTNMLCINLFYFWRLNVQENCPTVATW